MEQIDIIKKGYFILEYLKWKGENIKYCEKCGVPIKPTNNRSKYCKECWKEIHKEQDKEYQKRKYNSRFLENLSQPQRIKHPQRLLFNSTMEKIDIIKKGCGYLRIFKVER